MALRLVIFAVQEFAMANLPTGPVQPVWLVMALAVLAHGVLFVWQAVGVLRAADAHSRSSGQMALVWGAQLTLIISALWVLSYSLEAWHLTQPDPDAALPDIADIRADRAAQYSLTLSPDRTRLELTGTLDVGITAQLTSFLNVHPSVTTIQLHSTGGNIFEARGLGMLIRSKGLNTHVMADCSSACTLAFIAGASRSMSPEARLGFHQYRLDTDKVVLSVDPAKEQERDRAAFRQAGVADWFRDRMFQSDAGGMWYPALSLLQDAGVVTEVLRQ